MEIVSPRNPCRTRSFLTAAGELALATESEEGDLLDMDSLEL